MGNDENVEFGLAECGWYSYSYSKWVHPWCQGRTHFRVSVRDSQIFHFLGWIIYICIKIIFQSAKYKELGMLWSFLHLSVRKNWTFSFLSMFIKPLLPSAYITTVTNMDEECTWSIISQFSQYCHEWGQELLTNRIVIIELQFWMDITL